jgi:hypothetical protein
VPETVVAIDVLTSPLAIPMPAGFRAAGTYFVNVDLSPVPTWPLPAPGLTVVLPLRNPMVPGQRIDLYRIDPVTGQFVPAFNVDGAPVTGVVGADGMTATFTRVARFSTIAGLIPERTTVAIDVEPYSPTEPPLIKLNTSRPTEVAILSTRDFDAYASVNRSTLKFGRTGDEASLARCNPGKIDVNHDGRLDLVCTFTTSLTGLRPGDVIAVLHGTTNDGSLIGGVDSVRVTD